MIWSCLGTNQVGDLIKIEGTLRKAGYWGGCIVIFYVLMHCPTVTQIKLTTVKKSEKKGESFYHF